LVAGAKGKRQKSKVKRQKEKGKKYSARNAGGGALRWIAKERHSQSRTKTAKGKGILLQKQRDAEDEKAKKKKNRIGCLLPTDLMRSLCMYHRMRGGKITTQIQEEMP